MPMPDNLSARLAAEHDAATLGAALVERLRADGRGDVAAAVATSLAGVNRDAAPGSTSRHRGTSVSTQAGPVAPDPH
ncbi:MAG: hypothetical protein QM820_08110 [Minicystis sp.]